MSVAAPPEAAGLDTPPSVPVFTGVDRARFEAEIQPAQRPALLKGVVADWPIVEAVRARGAEAALEDARAVGNCDLDMFSAPPEVAGRYSYTEDVSDVNFTRARTTLHELFDQLVAHRDDDAPPGMYSSAVPLRDALAGLAEACPMPLLDPEEERLTSLWVGNRGRTAAHWDLPQNLACVIAGRRRFTLFPIEQAKNLYIGPLDRTLAGQATSLVDFHAPDLERFPKFAEAWAHAEIADLEPGDALYLPSVWLHHVEALDPIGMMINFWWRDGPKHLITPMLTLMHGLLTVRDLPEAERARWRSLFDLYLFQTDGDPMAHLPDAARGVFGEPTPETLARVRAMLSRSLNR